MPPEPSASRWDRVVARLEEAIALPPGEREAYLSRLPDEPEIRDEVLSLLAVETPPSDILEHPVLEWITGTALRPVKSRLTEPQWQQFRQELIPMLDAAYPARPDGRTFFPFRRIFVVAQTG